MTLKQELDVLYQLLINEDDHEPNQEEQITPQDKQGLLNQRKLVADTVISMSENMMRDARADKILLFLKLRY